MARDVAAVQRDGLASGQLLIQRCASCGALRNPPRPMCPSCQSVEWDHMEASGRGSVYSWILPRHAVPDGATPTIAIVELEEGVRVIAGVDRADGDTITTGQPVTARFQSDGDGAQYLSFAPATGAGTTPAPPAPSPPRPRRLPIARTSWDRVAIAGIGQTEFSKDSGRSELQLAAEASAAAITDAGLTVGDVDGLVTYTMDGTSEIDLMDALGIPELSFQARAVGGGYAANPALQLAAAAIVSGAASCVLVWRSLNERSQYRFGQPLAPPRPDPRAERFLTTPPALYALSYQRYLATYGITNEDLGRYSVVARKHAANNPHAWFHNRPITLDDHQSSRWIVEPVLRLLDCCQESDGAVALVVTAADRAADGPATPVKISAAAQSYVRGHGGGLLGFFEGDLADLPEGRSVARQMFESSGLTIDDMSAAMIYENFSPLVLLQLEALGACKPGEAKDFVADGHIEVGGRLPVNTHGGLLGEAYIHGLNNVLEGVRQIRGSSSNQVADARHVVVANAVGGLILSAPDA